MRRFVDTPYGPMPGCPDCGVIHIGGPHLCEHGVTSGPAVEFSVMVKIEDEATYRWLLGDPD